MELSCNYEYKGGSIMCVEHVVRMELSHNYECKGEKFLRYGKFMYYVKLLLGRAHVLYPTSFPSALKTLSRAMSLLVPLRTLQVQLRK